MDLLLKNKVILITGAGSGIGRASAKLFAEEGAKVIVSNRNIENGNETVKIIKENGGEAFFIQCDVSKEDEVKNLIQEIVVHFNRLDCAFNCAGTDGIKNTISNLSTNDWDEVINTNLKSTFWLVKYEAEQMKKQEKKSNYCIVNMGSVSGLLGRPSRSAYNASRSGVISLTKTAAIEFIGDGIRINAVAPGAVDTELFKKFTKGSKEIREEYIKAHPIGRICQPEEVAQTALFLISDLSSFIIGQSIIIDGGFSLL